MSRNISKVDGECLFYGIMFQLRPYYLEFNCQSLFVLYDLRLAGSDSRKIASGSVEFLSTDTNLYLKL